MIYIADSLIEGFFPANCTIKVKPITTGIVAQLVHDEEVRSLVTMGCLAESIGRALVVEDFPTIGDDPFPGVNPGFVPGDNLIVLMSFDMQDNATWSEFIFGA